MSRPLRRAELAAHAASVVAVVLTLVVVGASYASESNPVAAWLIAQAGLETWALATPLAVGAVFAALRWCRRFDGAGDRLRVVHVAWLVPTLLALDAAGNVVALAVVGWPETLAPATIHAALGVSGLAAVVAFRRALVAEARAAVVAWPRHDRRVVVAAVALVVFSAALAGVPAGVFGPGAPAETVDRVAASGSVIEDFEDQSLNADTNDGGTWSTTNSNPKEGSYSARYDGSCGGGCDYTRSFSASSYNSVSWYLDFSSLPGGGAYSGIFDLRESGTDGPEIRVEEDGSVLTRYDGSNHDTGADLVADEYYKFEVKNIDYANDQYDLSIIDSSGTEIGSATDQGFQSSIGSINEYNWRGYDEEIFADYVGANGTTIGQTLSGTVTNESGGAITDATVEAHNSSQGTLNGSDTTDSNGDYSIGGLDSGTYDVKFAADGYGTVWKNDTDVTSDTTLDATLTATGTLVVLAAGPLHQSKKEWWDQTGDVTFAARPISPNGSDITVTFYLENGTGSFQQIGQSTVSNNTTATTTSPVVPYSKQWYVTLSTATGRSGTTQDQDWTVNYPGYMTVINGTSGDPIQGTTVLVNATGSIPGGTPITFDTSAPDGNVSLEGIPQHDPPDQFLHWRANVSASGYNSSERVFLWPSNDTDVVLYPTGTAGLYEQCFSLEDETGNYPTGESYLEVEAFVGGSFVTVASTPFGADGQAEVNLIDGETYRVLVHNSQGDVRSVGSYTGADDGDGCTQLTIDKKTILDDDVDDPRYNANASITDAPAIDARLKITNGTADNTRLVYWPYGDQANATTVQFGIVGTVKHTAPLTSDEANGTWVVEWRFNLDGESVTWRRVLGKDNLSAGIPLDPFWKGFIGMVLLVIIAGGFGQLRAEVGAVVVSLVAGVLWAAGWLPAAASAGAIALALVIAGALYANSKTDQMVS